MKMNFKVVYNNNVIENGRMTTAVWKYRAQLDIAKRANTVKVKSKLEGSGRWRYDLGTFDINFDINNIEEIKKFVEYVFRKEDEDHGYYNINDTYKAEVEE